MQTSNVDTETGLRSDRTDRRPFAQEKTNVTAVFGQRWDILVVLALAIAYFAWFAQPLLLAVSDNVRLLAAFNVDEADHVKVIRQALDSGSLLLAPSRYGWMYYNLSFLPVLLLNLFRPVSDQEILVIQRALSILFGIGTVAATFILARRYFGRLAAWLAALFLLLVLTFLEMSVMSHSDVTQLFFLVAGIYCCCRLAEDGHSRWLWGASICAGFAFASKYWGMFLLPFIWSVRTFQAIVSPSTEIGVNAPRVARLLRWLTAAVGVVGLVTGLVVIPRVAALFTDANSGEIYFGIPRTRILDTAQSVAAAVGGSLVLLFLIGPFWKRIGRRPRLAWILREGAISLVIFAGAFFVVSPNAVLSVQRSFLRGFLSQVLHHASFGGTFKEESSGLMWGRLLWSPELLDSLILGLAAISLALTAVRTLRDGWRALFRPRSIMWEWVIFCLALLFIAGKSRTHRSLLSTIPFLCMFAAHTVSELTERFSTRLPRTVARMTTAGVVLAVVSLELFFSWGTLTAFRQTTARRVEDSVAVSAGHWLAERYPSSVRVLYDNYSYVPPVFTDAYLTDWGGNLELLRTLEPDVVIVTVEQSRQFSDPGQTENYVRGKKEFMIRHEYYAGLREERVGYTLVRDFGQVLIYEKKHQ